MKASLLVGHALKVHPKKQTIGTRRRDGRDEVSKNTRDAPQMGTLFSDAGWLFRAASNAADVDEKLGTTSENLENIARIEEEAFERLEKIVS